MRLHSYFRSSSSYRLRIALGLKDLDYEIAPVNLREGEQASDDFTARNPFAGVPMLEADGQDRAQSMAILEWLDEAYPDYPLLPDGMEERFTVRELAHAIATDLHAPLNLKVLKYLKSPLGHDQQEIDIWYRHWLGITLGAVEKRLAQLGCGDFLMSRAGLFEVLLIPQLYNARRFHFDLSKSAHMMRIEEACFKLPAFQKAHPDKQLDNPNRT